MSFLRFAALLILGVWIGGLVALGGIAAPNIFETLQTVDPLAGRDTAGRVFGAILNQFQRVSWVLAGLLMLLMFTRRILGPPPRGFNLRFLGLMVMLGISLTTALVIAPRIAQIRDATSGSIANLAEDDARKLQFGRLHGWSNGLMLVSLLTGVGLFWAETRDLH